MAALNLNKVILVGRITSDPELKQTQSGVPVTSFTVAVNRTRGKDKEQETDFINCVAWRQTAEFASKYFHKGSSICVIGSIQTRSYMTDSGEKRYVTEVVCDEVKFVDIKGYSGPQNATSSSYVPGAYTNDTSTGEVKASFEEVKDDDDLPF